ncbi:porin [Vibrio sonorensis]|uniref:porin n=1 Tax=Vibrio sonorensis TaxID=1004316 RepID=UPI0008D99CDA|nr:porin [Vibrio sonorensis]
MKKNLITLGLFAAGSVFTIGSANAIELYNTDGVSVDLKGDVEVRYVKSIDEGSELKQEIDDADFGFDARYAINGNKDLQVGAYLEFSGDNDDRAKDNTSVGDVYVALYSAEHTLKVGKTATILDDAGISNDYLFGISSFVSDVDFSGEEVVRYEFDNGQFYAGVALNQDKHNAQRIGEDGSYFDGKIGYRVEDFDFTGFFGSVEEKGVNGDGQALDSDGSLFALEIRYAGVENLNLGAAYYMVDLDDVETGTFALAADYTLANNVNLAGGVSLSDYESGDDAVSWFANTSYSFAPNTKVYFEIGGNDVDDSELGYGVGLTAEF